MTDVAIPDSLPPHWQSVSMKWLLRFRNGADYGGVLDDLGAVPVIGSGGEFARASAHLFDGESVLFGRKGTVDRPLHIDGRFWTIDTMYYTELGPRIFGRFLYYFALTIPYSLLSTSTALPSMTQSTLGAVRVPLPPLEKQRAIADFLDRETAQIDAMVDAQERLVALLEERRRAVVRDAVTTGIQTGEDPSQPPSHWVRLPIKALGRTQSGVGFPEAEQGLADLPFPFYKVNALGRADADGVIRERYDTIDADTVARLRATVIPAGSVVLAKIGAALLLSRFRMLAYDSCIDNNMIAFIPNKRVLGRYAMYAFEQLNLDQLVNPGAVPSLSDRVLRDFRLAWPPIDDQAEIVDYLDGATARIDAMIAKARESIALMRERRVAVISAAVTGRIDIRTGIERAERDLEEAQT